MGIDAGADCALQVPDGSSGLVICRCHIRYQIEHVAGARAQNYLEGGEKSRRSCTRSIWLHNHWNFSHLVPSGDLKESRIWLTLLDVRERVGGLAKTGISLSALYYQFEVG
jgi:hypothetical protein